MKTLFPVLLVFITLACGAEDPTEMRAEGAVDIGMADHVPDNHIVDVSLPKMVGNVGDVTISVDDSFAVRTTDHRSDQVSVLIEVENSDGAAMNMLVFQGGMFHPELIDGETHVFSTMNPAEGDPNAYVVGCSGDFLGSWDYDGASISVAIAVDREGDTLTYDYLASFPAMAGGGGEGMVGGQFVVETQGL